jgi:GNAT superfamily N-acetyltransferase
MDGKLVLDIPLATICYSRTMTSPNDLQLEPLDYETAWLERERLLPMMAQIEPRTGTLAYLMAEEKANGMPLAARWERSFIAREGEPPVGVAIIYERAAEPDSNHYKEAELHLGVLAARHDKHGRGLGSLMMATFIDSAVQLPHFTADKRESIRHIGLTVDGQNPAKRLYESFGLLTVGTTVRDGKLLHIMRAPVADALQSAGYQRVRQQ